ncbi:MAG: hypothetical protein WCP92_04630 [bacterium]
MNEYTVVDNKITIDEFIKKYKIPAVVDMNSLEGSFLQEQLDQYNE